MALFKILRGSKNAFDIDVSKQDCKPPFNDGYCYFLTDSRLFYIDYATYNADGSINIKSRIPLNAFIDNKNWDDIIGYIETSLASANNYTDEKISTAYSLKDAITIVSTEEDKKDLNDYIEFGNYVAQGASAKTLLNCPITDGFFLHVERNSINTNGAQYCKQRLISWRTQTEWWRTCSNGQWTDWVNISMPSNINLLDNWYWLDPINSRNQNSYIEQSPTIDRWYSSGALTVELTSNGLKLSAASDDVGYFRQYTNDGYKKGTYTLSLLVTEVKLPDDTSKHHVVYLSDKTSHAYSDSAIKNIDSPGIITLTAPIAVDGDFNRVQFDIRAGGSITISAIKLEYGNTQTLATLDSSGSWVLNDAPPIKEIEQLKCIQRKPTRFNINDNGEVIGVINVQDDQAYHMIYSTLNKPGYEDVGADPAGSANTAEVAAKNYAKNYTDEALVTAKNYTDSMIEWGLF